MQNVRTFGAEGNGTHDDTEAFEKSIAAAVAAGGDTVYVPASKGAYIISKMLEGASRVNWRGDGRFLSTLKAKEKAGSSIAIILKLSGCSDLEIVDLGFDGGNLAACETAMFSGSGSSNVELRGVGVWRINNTAESGEKIKNWVGVQLIGSAAVTIAGSEFVDCAQALLIENPAGGHIVEGNTVEAPGAHMLNGLKAISSSANNHPFSVIGNTVSGAVLDPTGNGQDAEGIVVRGIRGARVVGNNVEGCHVAGIFIGAEAFDATVVGNTCRANWNSATRGTGIYTEVELGATSGLVGLTVSGNTCAENGTGIEAPHSEGITISGNVCHTNKGGGILANSDRSMVYGNTVYNNWQKYTPTELAAAGGIWALGRKCQFFGNTCFDNQTTTTQKYGIAAKGDSRVGVNSLLGNGISELFLDSENNQKLRWETFPANAAKATGSEATAVVGTIYLCEVEVTESFLPSGVEILNAELTGGSVIVAIYDRYGTLLVSSTTAGTAASGKGTYQKVSFASTIGLIPGRYFVALQANATTYKFRAVPETSLRSATASVAGTFGTLSNPLSSIPTTFTANVGPVATIF
jgi:parallel beta-helix repeat protein